QRRRAAAQPAIRRLQTKNGLLAGPADELSRAETGNRLHQSALELIALDPPLHPLQTGLEGDGIGWRGQQASQDKRAQAHDELQEQSGLMGYRAGPGKLECQRAAVARA